MESREQTSESRIRYLEETTEELREELEYTQEVMRAIGRALGVAIVGTCGRCNEGMIFRRKGTLSCTHCQYHHSVD